jgi:hypothetical protein
VIDAPRRLSPPSGLPHRFARASRLGVLSLVVALGPAGAAMTALGAQTVRPAVVEYQERARGKFELVNETLFPLTVVIEPRGFRVEESGELVDEPLDTTRIRVKLSAMSFRIPPRQSYTVFYDATADRFPAWFLIASTLSGAKTQTGINVRVELPHVVYMLQKTPLRRADVAIRAFDFDSTTKRARVQLENTGAALGRVLSSEISVDGKHSVPGGAFPLFPHSRRWHEIPWDGDRSPDTIVLRFANFAIEERKPQQPGH